MSSFPSVVSTISNPQPTDKLNSPSHSTIEQGQNDAISKLETFIGTLSSIQGTLMYDIRAAASPGGGHVQTANKGGTGQTAFTKGDILVASSASVLTKIAVGTNNYALVADSSQPTGVKWANVAAPSFAAGQTSRTATGSFSIVHGLGTTPSLIKITALFGELNTAVGGISIGAATATGSQSASGWAERTSAKDPRQNSSNIIYIVDNASNEYAVGALTTLDATNITINITGFTGSGLSNPVLYIQWEAWA